jgi:hypothetical protein
MMNREPSKIEVQHTFPALDQSLYNLLPQDATFYKEVTGIEDDAALKQHILDIQAKAYKVSGPLNTSFCCSKTHLFTARLPLTRASIFSFLPGILFVRLC